MERLDFHLVLANLKKKALESGEYDSTEIKDPFRFLGNLFDEIFIEKGWEIQNIKKYKQKFYNLMREKSKPRGE